MHDIDRSTMGYEFEDNVFETNEFESPRNYGTGPFSEEEEIALAGELLGVTDEAELDQFLGNLVKKAWRGVKKVGSAVGQVAKPLVGALKPLAKKALPAIGGAIGSAVAPGVGTAIGSALGSAVGNALEMEFEGMNPDEMEFETARRVVRIAGDAARKAAQLLPSRDPVSAVRSAVTSAAKKYVPNLSAFGFEAETADGASTSERSGRWVRRGNQIILLGV